jgi:uncharacterized membrane protein YdbT with pleckstrin-like domain
MDNWIKLIKAMVRPYLIITGWTLYLVAIPLGFDIPPFLDYFIKAVAAIYVAERSYKRFRENGKTHQ